MRIFLLLAIKIYWKYLPENKRRCCLFKESCSKYVFHQAKEKGFFMGMASLFQRIKKCKPGYELFLDQEKFSIKLADNSILSEEEINPNLINTYKFLLYLKADE
ncbi:MAG: membrane protein insertion efficiency factor YidD [Chitinophagales bacterium]|nr:membrane protein insertion efficiency factor YidD [Chitinophagales bacterium]